MTDHRAEWIEDLYAAGRVIQSGQVVRLRDLVPPGHVLCCVCFEAIPVDMLWVDGVGVRWDICEPCKLAEYRAMGLL